LNTATPCPSQNILFARVNGDNTLVWDTLYDSSQGVLIWGGGLSLTGDLTVSGLAYFTENYSDTLQSLTNAGLSLGGNYAAGDLAEIDFFNTNTSGAGFNFHQMTSGAAATLLASLTTSGLNLGANEGLSINGTSVLSATTVSVANGNNATVPPGSYLILVTNPANGDVGVYVLGGTEVAFIGSAIGTWITPTTSPAAGKTSVCWSGSAYEIYNNYGSTETFTVTLL
jgi:hypothetical protein